MSGRQDGNGWVGGWKTGWMEDWMDRKNSVRDKVIGKKWVYSDSERSTLHRQSVGHRRG